MKNEAEEFLVGDQFEKMNEAVDAIGSESEPEEESKVVLAASPPIRMDANTELAVSSYGQATAINAYQTAISTYNMSEMKGARETFPVLTVIDPVDNKTMKYKLNKPSCAKYLVLKNTGISNMLKGERMVKEGQKIQLEAYRDLLRYGTVLAINDHEHGQQKKLKVEDQQTRVIQEEQADMKVREMEVALKAEKAKLSLLRSPP